MQLCFYTTRYTERTKNEHHIAYGIYRVHATQTHSHFIFFFMDPAIWLNMAKVRTMCCALSTVCVLNVACHVPSFVRLKYNANRTQTDFCSIPYSIHHSLHHSTRICAYQCFKEFMPFRLHTFYRMPFDKFLFSYSQFCYCCLLYGAFHIHLL